MLTSTDTRHLIFTDRVLKHIVICKVDQYPFRPNLELCRFAITISIYKLCNAVDCDPIPQSGQNVF